MRPSLWIFRGTHGNVAVNAGATETLIAGVPDRAALDSARQFITARVLAPLRKIVVLDGDSAEVLAMLTLAGDTAVAFAHENVRNRFLGALLEKLGVSPAPVGFSDVLQLNVGSEEIHSVHQPTGYANSDVLVHFERMNVVLFGMGVVSDAYPTLNGSRGADVNGIVQSLDRFLSYPPGAAFVPGRGPLMNTADVVRYHAALSQAFEHVRALVDSGASLEKVIRSVQPPSLGATAGAARNGPEFIRQIYDIARRLRANGSPR